MRTTRITGEREPGRRGRRFRGHATGATVLAVAARKAATFRRSACALAISAIFTGLVVTPASAAPLGFIYICKQAEPGSGVTGTFTFTVVDPPQNPQTVQVPVGGCSGAIGIARPSPQGITITETPTNDALVSKIDVPSGTIIVPHKKFSPTITVADDVSTNNNKGAKPGDPGAITFTNTNPVCSPNFWAVDLKTGAQIGSLLNGSSIGPITNSQAVVKLDLNPLPEIKCKQANIVVEYEGPPSGWTVDIGDSITNDGWGGGSGSPGKACAEVQVLNSVVTHYRDCGGSEVLPLAPALVPNPLSLQDGALKFVVKNDYVSVGQPFAKSAGTGKSFHIPDTGLPDPDGSKIFAAFNRVISGPGNRVGTGVRRVMITME